MTTSSKTNKMEDLKEELRGRLFYVGLPKKYWPGLVQFFEENIAQTKEAGRKEAINKAKKLLKSIVWESEWQKVNTFLQELQSK